MNYEVTIPWVPGDPAPSHSISGYIGGIGIIESWGVPADRLRAAGWVPACELAEALAALNPPEGHVKPTRKERSEALFASKDELRRITLEREAWRSVALQGANPDMAELIEARYMAQLGRLLAQQGPSKP